MLYLKKITKIYVAERKENDSGNERRIQRSNEESDQIESLLRLQEKEDSVVAPYKGLVPTVSRFCDVKEESSPRSDHIGQWGRAALPTAPE